MVARIAFIFEDEQLPSGTLTWPLKSYLPSRKVAFQPPFFSGYVKPWGVDSDKKCSSNLDHETPILEVKTKNISGATT